MAIKKNNMSSSREASSKLFKQCKKSNNFLWQTHRLNKRNKRKIGALRNVFLRRRRKLSDFHRCLVAKRIFCNLYGGTRSLKLRALKKQKNISKQRKGPIITNFVRIIESRLDTVVFRMNYFASFAAARQNISHGFVLVNYKPVNVCSYTLSYGDIVSFIPRIRSKLVLALSNRISTVDRALCTIKEKNILLKRRRKKLRELHKELDCSLTHNWAAKASRESSKTLSTNRNRIQIPYENYKSSKQGKLKSLRQGMWFVSPNMLVNNKLYSGLIMKSSHLEISYTKATAVFLFPTQDIYLPVIVDVRDSLKGIHRG